MAQASFPATGRRGTDDAGPADEERAARAKARAARKAKMLEVLTTEQRDQFTRLQGKKFDFPSQRGRS
jgi:Spy/CpxP family protein refolding chaperone